MEQNKKEKIGPKRDPILDLAKYKDQKIRVSFYRGREITGYLKGYDQLMNLVLDEVEEILLPAVTGIDDGEASEVIKRYNGETRKLGFVVVRSGLILTISPEDGSEIIENPLALDSNEPAVI